MSILEGGYAIQQDYLKTFFIDDEAEDYNAFDLLDDIYAWWWDLPREERAQTPLPRIHILDEKRGFESIVIWVCTRRLVRHDDDVEGVGRLGELDKDTLRKKKFVTAFGRNRNFDEGQMVFHVLPAQNL